MSQNVSQFSYPRDGACCHLLMVPRLGGYPCSPWHPADAREMAVWGDRGARHSKAQGGQPDAKCRGQLRERTFLPKVGRVEKYP